MSWTVVQQAIETFVTRARWICAAAVPAFITINGIWDLVPQSTADKIVQTFLALGFLSVAEVYRNGKEQ